MGDICCEQETLPDRRQTRSVISIYTKRDRNALRIVGGALTPYSITYLILILKLDLLPILASL